VDDAIISGLTMKMLARESVAGVNSAVDFIAHTPESAKGVQALKVMASDLFNPSVPYLKNGRRVPGIEINGVGFSKEDWLRFLRGELEPVGDSFSATRGWRRIDTHLETKLNETYGYLRARIIDDVNNRVRNETGSFLFDVFKDAVEALK